MCIVTALGGTSEAKELCLRLPRKHPASVGAPSAVPCRFPAPALLSAASAERGGCTGRRAVPPLQLRRCPLRAEQPCVSAPCHRPKGCQPAPDLGLGPPRTAAERFPRCLLISFGALQFPFPITGPAPRAGWAWRVPPAWLGSDAGPVGLREGGDGRSGGAEQGRASVTGRASSRSCPLQKSLEVPAPLRMESSG